MNDVRIGCVIRIAEAHLPIGYHSIWVYRTLFPRFDTIGKNN